ncbi:MAG: hypothetical protein ACOY46_07090 [Bacillota bacterium]
MNNTRLTPFQIASAYIGVTIGAGFASGQEILQFFSYFGPASFGAIILAAFMFYFFGVIILNSGYHLKADSYQEVVYKAGGKFVGLIVDITITFFLFGSFTAMLAGSSSTFTQQLGLPPLFGSILMAAISMVTVLFGISGIVNALSLLIPIIFTGIIIMTLAIIYLFPISLNDISNLSRPWEAILPLWPLSAVTYVSYNLIVAIAILAPMGKMTASRADMEKGALAGGIGLGIGITAINLILFSLPEASSYNIPMNYVANFLSPAVGSTYFIILVAAIYTTAAGGLYGISSRLADPAGPRFKIMVPIIATGGILASSIGFTSLVRYLYSGVGIVGLILLGALVYDHLRFRIKA